MKESQVLATLAMACAIFFAQPTRGSILWSTICCTERCSFAIALCVCVHARGTNEFRRPSSRLFACVRLVVKRSVCATQISRFLSQIARIERVTECHHRRTGWASRMVVVVVVFVVVLTSTHVHNTEPVVVLSFCHSRAATTRGGGGG